MKRFILEQSDTELYTSHSGLALIGLCLNRYTTLSKTVDNAIPLRHGMAHSDLIKCYLGQLCLGKSDFEAVEAARDDRYFKEALAIKQVPSSARLRQRLDTSANTLLPVMYNTNIEFLATAQVPVSPLNTGHVALDIDVFPMDNSRSKKEGVSRTYKGHDGYAPIAAYLGQEGWCLACELREGKQHCQKEFLYTLERVLPNAKRLTDARLLVRLDSGHDAQETRDTLLQADVDYILKWNPRRHDPAAWLARADALNQWVTPRDGKRVTTFSDIDRQLVNGKTLCVRRVMQVTERTIDKHGQRLLLPMISVEGWWTTLDQQQYDDQQIIALYKDHATSEQFHSEFKTDLDLERLPSGKFDTNDLIMTLAAISYNMLRWIGLIGLTGTISPIRHPRRASPLENSDSGTDVPRCAFDRHRASLEAALLASLHRLSCLR